MRDEQAAPGQVELDEGQVGPTAGQVRPDAGHLRADAGQLGADEGAGGVGPGRAGRREWIGLAALILPLLLVSMDVSVLFFAVPFINGDLQPTSTQQLWIFDIYGFVLAGLLITMGSLGDRIGRRRLLMIGAAGFGAASVLAAYATSAEMLIVARALLGLGGATLMPSTGGLIRNMFHDQRQRATAIAIWTAGLTFGVAMGPILSGLLLEHFWWGSVFLINLPAMALLLLVAPVLIPEFRNPSPGRFDLVSSALSMACVLPIIYAIKEIAAHGLDTIRVAAMLTGLLFGLAFLRRQASRPDPMIDLRMFRNGRFSAAMGMNLVSVFALTGFAIFTTQYLQSVLGMSPLEAALWSLLASVGVGAAAPVVTTLGQRGVNRAHLTAASFLVAVTGMVVLSWAEGLWPVLAGATLMSAGVVAALSQIAEMIMGDAPPERAGTVSAVLETASEFGGALGIAVLGSIGTAIYRADIVGSLPDGLPGGRSGDAAQAAGETLGGAVAVAGQLPAQVGAALRTAAGEAFTHGMHVAATVVAAVLFLTAAACVHLSRKFDRTVDTALT